MKLFYMIAALIFLPPNLALYAEDQHKHKTEKHEGEHAESEGHEEHGDHEEEEAKPNVGPNKGVLAYSEDNGFELSPEALLKFKIKTQALEGKQPWTLPLSALLLTGDEKNIFRVRNHAFKRIDIEVVQKIQKTVRISSSELQKGDSVVIEGVGFLRIVELDATSGETGHSH